MQYIALVENSLVRHRSIDLLLEGGMKGIGGVWRGGKEKIGGLRADGSYFTEFSRVN
jgi:hypothetical protein